MNESENKTAKDLLDESIESIKAKKIESELEEDSEELDLSDEEINDETNELEVPDGCDAEDDTFGDDNEKMLGSDNEDISGDKDDLEEINDKDIEESISIKDKILSVCKICLKTLFFTFFGLIHLFLLLLPLLFLYSSFNWVLALCNCNYCSSDYLCIYFRL